MIQRHIQPQEAEMEKISLDTLSNVYAERITPQHAIMILEFLAGRFKVRSVSDEAKARKVQRQTVYNRIKSGTVATINLNNKQFIIY